MIKKEKLSLIIITVFLLSVCLTSCNDKTYENKDQVINNIVDKTNKNESKNEEAIEKRVLIKRVFDNDNSSYKYIYDDNLNSEEYTEFYPENMNIDRLKFISLDYLNDQLKEVEVIEEFKNIASGEKVLINAVYPEGIPMLKIKWENEDISGEYIFQYNGKDGNDDSIVFIY